MSESTQTRREFLTASVAQFGGGWLLLRLPLLSGLAACARDAAERADPFSTFTPAQGATFRAFAARVIPSDDEAPGATEAGAVYFADRAIAGPLAPLAEP
ncbi:MAG: gluconate 2-dehydrogenase subunit 3 family protein, partial [Longimicrobiales bacterium]